jgi:hypothetical protein
MAIERTFPANPDVAIHITMNFMQLWGELLKEADRDKLLLSVARLESWASKSAASYQLF